jgi:hypothetical protein
LTPEEQAARCLSDAGITDADLEKIYRAIEADDARADSIAESPMWKDPDIHKKLAAMRVEQAQKQQAEESRSETKHYIDSAPNVTVDGKIDPTISVMGQPVRQADGSIKWEISNSGKKPKPAVNVTADGKIDVRKSIMGSPVRQADGSVIWQV